MKILELIRAFFFGPKPIAVRSCKHHPGGDMILEVEWSHGLVSKYRGSCTVWHDCATGDRCASWFESWLCDRWQQIRWQKDDKCKP